MVSFMLFLFLICYNFCKANLIWGGDFELYTGNWLQLYSNGYYMDIPSNTSNWYSANLGNIQIKYYTNIAITTKGVDLAGAAPYTLCQNVSLITDRRSQLNFSLFSDPSQTNTNLTAWLNGKLIKWLFLPESKAFLSGSVYFNPTQTKNQICFNETHDGGQLYAGGFIDNITLLQADLYNISFILSVSQQYSSIYLSSDFQFDEKLGKQLFIQYFMQANGTTLANFSYGASVDGLLVIQAYPNFSFQLKSLNFLATNSMASNLMVMFNISVSSQNIRYQFKKKYPQNNEQSYKDPQKYLQDDLSFGQLEILKVSERILKVVVRNIKIASSFLKISFSSYLIFNIISFENLSLFYIFLNFKSIPTFTKQIYDHLMTIAFLQQSVSDWVQKLFNLNENPFYYLQQSEAVPELLQSNSENMQMMQLGSYGFSSLALNNNFQSFAVLGFLVVKLLLLKLFFRCMSRQKKKALGIKGNIFIVILVQFMQSIPCFVVSAIPRILSSSLSYVQRVETICQLTMFYFCLLGLSLYFIQKQKKRKNRKKQPQVQQNRINQSKHKVENSISARINQLNNSTGIFNQPLLRSRKVKKQKNQSSLMHPRTCQANLPIIKRPNPTVNRSIKQGPSNTKIVPKLLLAKAKPNSYAEVTYSLLLLTIPFLISLTQVRTFLIVNSAIITLKVYLFLRVCNCKNKLSKALQLLQNAVWVIHNSVFIAFYLIDEFGLEQNNILTQTLGIACILTILAGCIIQIAKIMIQIITKTRSLIKKVSEMCCTKNKQNKDQKDKPQIPNKQSENRNSIAHHKVSNERKMQRVTYFSKENNKKIIKIKFAFEDQSLS